MTTAANTSPAATAPLAAAAFCIDDVSSAVRDLHNKMADVIIIDNSGSSTGLDTFYVNNLPETVSVQAIEDLQKYHTNLVAASNLTLGTKSIPLMAANKELLQTVLTIPMVGKDSFKASFNRDNKTPTKDADGTIGSVTTHGTFLNKFHVTGTDNVGELAKIRKMLAGQASAAFAAMAK